MPPSSSQQEPGEEEPAGQRELRLLEWGIGFALLLRDLGSYWSRKDHMNTSNNSQPEQVEQDQERAHEARREFRLYVWGFGLALLLTVLAFALVNWTQLGRHTTFVVIGVLALVQMIVHFRFFLHIGFQRQREDLELILFSAVLLIIMVSGTVWIMTNLAARMAIVPGW